MEIIVNLILAVLLIIFYVVRNNKKEKMAASSTQEPFKSTKHNPVYLARLDEVKRQAEERGATATVQSIRDMKYKGPLPTMKPDGSFTDLQSKILTYNIAGINFRRGLENYIGDFMGYLNPEPKNQYDPNAIAIHHSDGKHLGYIHADNTDEVRNLHIPFPIPIWGKIEEDYDEDDDRIFYRGTISIDFHPKVSPSNL